MTELVPVSIGEYVVVKRPYRYAVVQAQKVTASQIRATGEWSSREGTYHRSAVLFAGPEDQARLLFDRLTSSDALCEDEKRKSDERRGKRNAEIIAKMLISKGVLQND